ncbi:MoaD/ThiS family protein [Asticcacaulis sp. AND118]|uniref:MoaD/ThiS family protein n=1 Tax=Asticcacaulis sp. AND118 TaxID=2840468 RepID=UPI001CFFFBA8|nr:MoaD/ThiS family protein [Asticcacaulis sp. AND118]UDF04285.1 MoaD/ThiS family protein [Asticcacaulis sp. AND118]
MKVTVLFFGKVADAMGKRQCVLDVPDTQAGLFTLRDSVLGQAFAAEALDMARVLMSVNQTLETRDRVLVDGDEVAFFPVFSGG